MAVLSSSSAAVGAAGLARARHTNAHASTSMDPARTHRSDCEACSCKIGSSSSTAETRGLVFSRHCGSRIGGAGGHEAVR